MAGSGWALGSALPEKEAQVLQVEVLQEVCPQSSCCSANTALEARAVPGLELGPGGEELVLPAPADSSSVTAHWILSQEITCSSAPWSPVSRANTAPCADACWTGEGHGEGAGPELVPECPDGYQQSQRR